MTDPPQLFGVLVTFRRTQRLAETLQQLTTQTRPLDALVVIDNAADPEVARLVGELPNARYLASPENVGPAGGIALGMAHVLERASDRDWILTLDDDDPPSESRTLARLIAFAVECADRDLDTAAVGLDGIRFDFRRGRAVTLTDDELRGPVAVDSIGGAHFPCYSVRAIRSVGSMRAELFFGFEELELGLRLRRAGWTLYADGPTVRRDRAARRGQGTAAAPRRTLEDPTWRRYYSLRNLLTILRDHGHPFTALRVSAVVGLAKPLANLPVAPRLAVRHLLLNARACRDGWTGRLGRTVDPPDATRLPSRKEQPGGS